MTALSKAALKAIWIERFQPTSSDFATLIDSWGDYSDALESMRAQVSAGATGIPRVIDSTTVKFTQITDYARVLLSGASTTAAAQSLLGGGAFGTIVFSAATTAAAQDSLGGGAVGISLFATATTAAALGLLGALPAATQAQMETATTTVAATTPGLQQNHPGHPKAWVNFHGTTTVSVRASYNIASVVRNGTGDYTVVFSTPFSSTAYCMTGICDPQIGVSEDPRGINIVSVSAGGIRFLCVTAGPTANDCEWVCATFFGDQ